MPNFSLEDIYKNLSPSTNTTTTVHKDIFALVGDLLYHPSGEASTFDEMKTDIESHFNKFSDDDSIAFADHFHGIGPSGPILKEKSNNYWKGLTNANSIIGGAKPVADNLPKISVFAVRGPKITPAKRGAEKISFFLNYTPSIVTSQMVPFLSVSFVTRGTTAGNMTTPGIVSFLLGSGPTSNLSAADKLLVNANFKVDHLTGSFTGSSAFGMEMFLMPQTLTNMDTLNSGVTRWTNVKPFLPFASIDGFDISILNAGAGAFAHKTGVLKLKIHDKLRLSEISEFIKGSDGTSRMSIETDYGWSYAGNRGAEDEYAQFINKNMKAHDKWSVVDSQFSFDGSGQVVITLKLVSRSASVLQGATLVGKESKIDQFYKAIKIIEAGKSIITGRKYYSADVLTTKIFNATASDGSTGLSPPEAKAAAAKLKSWASGFDPEQLRSFATAVDLIANPESWKAAMADLTGLVDNKIAGLAEGIDPFRPRSEIPHFVGKTATLKHK